MTIVRDFLQWLATAPSNERAEGRMLKLLDDPSPLVRRSLADALAPSPAAPAPVIIASLPINRRSRRRSTLCRRF
jgi:hypothetical protein